MPWMIAALLANPFTGRDPDVVVVRDLGLDPVSVTALLADLRNAEALFDDGCVQDWEANTADRAVARWTPGPMNRRVSLAVVEADPGRKVKWEAEGDRGFFVIWRVVETDAGSRVTVETPLLAPPWPVRGLFYNHVQPAWRGCYEAALGRLKAR